MRLIDADALIKESCEIKLTSDEAYHCVIGREKVLELIQNAPTVERPTGEWYYSCQNGWHCSICQQIVKDMPTVMGKANFDYCPNCGAKMLKGEVEI